MRMKLISTSLQEQAKIILDEITASTTEYWHPTPRDPSHGDSNFEYAYMKFLNGNLNYFNFENMVAQTTENDPFNPEFPNTVAVCDYTKELTNTDTPYGRMCVWYIPAKGKIKPHYDPWQYHRNIIRNILIVSKNVENKHSIVIEGETIIPLNGMLFQFDPATELHSFINDSDEPFYFLGYDFWQKDKLELAKQELDIQKIINNPTRLASCGWHGTDYKYVSPLI
jgi:hypothetical protein